MKKFKALLLCEGGYIVDLGQQKAYFYPNLGFEELATMAQWNSLCKSHEFTEVWLSPEQVAAVDLQIAKNASASYKAPLEQLMYKELAEAFCAQWKIKNPHWESPMSGYIEAVEKFDSDYVKFISRNFEIPQVEIYIHVSNYDC